MRLATVPAGRPLRLLTLAIAVSLGASFGVAPRWACAEPATAPQAPAAESAAPAAAAGSAVTQAATVAQEAKEAELPSAKFPLSGEVTLGTSVGAGTFVPGEGNRPAVDGYFSLRAAYQFMPGLSLSASELVYHNFVTNADSGAARPYDTDYLDPFFTLAFTPQTTVEDGTRQPYEWPGGVRISANVTARPRVSRASKFANQNLAIGPGLSLSRPKLFGVLSLAIGTSIIKNFSDYTNATVDGNEFRVMGRPGGAEQLSGNLIATSTVNLSYYWRHSLSASLQLTERINFSVIYLLFNNFTAYDGPNDAYTSRYASLGRGRPDSQWGIASLSVGIDKASRSVVGLSAFTISSPLSADGKSYRFPFWDARSTADNFSSINLSLTQSY